MRKILQLAQEYINADVGGGGGGESHNIRDPVGYKTLITGNMSNENDDVRQKWPAEVDIFSLSVL